jgi:hypothetical protein
MILATEHYPLAAPIVLVTPAGGETEECTLNWKMNGEPEEMLINAFKQHLQPTVTGTEQRSGLWKQRGRDRNAEPITNHASAPMVEAETPTILCTAKPTRSTASEDHPIANEAFEKNEPLQAVESASEIADSTEEVSVRISIYVEKSADRHFS